MLERFPKLCISVVEPTVQGARAAVERAAAGGAFAEVRLDALAAVPTVESLAAVCADASAPLLLTWRRPRDGGRRDLDDDARLALLAGAAKAYGTAVDVEFDLAARIDDLGLDRDRVVLSHHDFEGTPRDLAGLVANMAAVPAAVYKVAVSTRETADLFAHFEVLARARRDGTRVVSIGMGPKGLATRVLGPAHGAAFTFCALDRGAESAPGQATLDEMRSLYRADATGPETIVTGLIGGSVGYSRSPRMHNGMFAELGLDWVYVPFEVDELTAFLRRAVGPEAPWTAAGFSVTNPFKTEVLALLDAVDPLARRVGAANTVVVREGRLFGYNTDVAGAIEPLEAAAGPLAGRRVGVIGAGGAARAVVCGLADRGASVSVFARRPERARELAEAFGAEAFGVDEVRSCRVEILVNTTPLGTRGIAEGESPVPAECLEGVGFAYDLVYAPERTRFLSDAEAAGCRTLGGLPMLAAQAALQFELWTGRKVSVDRLLELARG